MGRRKRAAGPEPEIARKRLELVMLVRAGQLNARAAAKQLHASGKTYYLWERKILQAALQAATDRTPGRPATVADPEKERLTTENVSLQQQVAALTAELKAAKLYAEFHREQRAPDGAVPAEEKKGR